MRQVVIPRKGGLEVLEVREPPDRQPREGEVRVGVDAAGVNFADVMARVGLYRDAPPFPRVMGYEVAGVIDLPSRRAGERVLAMPHFGGHSDGGCGSQRQGISMPEGVSFAAGAALPGVWPT